MENMLGNGNGGRKSTTKKQNEEDVPIPSCDDFCMDSILNLNECDQCYEDMISLLAQDDTDHDDAEENVFKKIQESFANDRLPECHSVSSKTCRMTFGSSKKLTLQRSSSFNGRVARSSRIGIRTGYDKLVKANRLSAKTRYMLLTCKPTFLNDR